MDRIIITENFHVFVAQGDDQPSRRVDFAKGMVVEESDMPEGHTAESWVEKGLAKAA